MDTFQGWLQPINLIDSLMKFHPLKVREMTRRAQENTFDPTSEPANAARSHPLQLAVGRLQPRNSKNPPKNQTKSKRASLFHRIVYCFRIISLSWQVPSSNKCQSLSDLNELRRRTARESGEQEGQQCSMQKTIIERLESFMPQEMNYKNVQTHQLYKLLL